MKPTQPVDIAGSSLESALDGVESRSAGAAGLVPTAALVFGGIMWMATAVVGLGFSESDGIALSWIAIFPTTFGYVARVVRKARLRAGRSAVAVPFVIGAVCGFFASLTLLVFFEGIWPSL